MADAKFLAPGDGERHALSPASETVVKATAEDTAGTLFLSETVIGPGFAGPPPHHHDGLHDLFYVLEGTLTVRIADNVGEAGPGAFLCVPPGVVHTFSNPGESPVRFLNFSTPGGWERYMRDLGEAARSRPLTPEAIGEIASRYDFHAD